jgi:hypothetical protein
MPGRSESESDNVTGADNQQERPSYESQCELLRITDGGLEGGILRGHTQSSLLKRRDEEMVQASQRCEETVLNYNRQPLGGCKTRLFAGNSEYPALLVLVTPRQ